MKYVQTKSGGVLYRRRDTIINPGKYDVYPSFGHMTK